MQIDRPLTRRRVLQGLGAVALTTAAGTAAQTQA
jgi:hypothetical protein